MNADTVSTVRALLIYDADREIDTAHPLYNEIMLFAESLTEVHVMVFIPHLAPAHERVTNLSPNAFVYYLPANIFWRIDELWPLMRYHLMWQKRFRPDVILSHSAHSGALLGYLLAKRYHKQFFVITTDAFLETSRLSWDFVQRYIVLRGASGIIVPGQDTADRISARIHHSRVWIVAPAIDRSFLERNTDVIRYAAVHPQHNLFLLTQLVHKRDLRFVLEVFADILYRFSRAALIIITPADAVAAIKGMVSARHGTSVYVYPEGDTINAYYAGANLLLSISDSEEARISVIRALALHVPVVATASASTRELFVGSPYERFMKPVGDVRGVSAAIGKLMGNQQARDDYRLNATILLQSVTLQTTAGYVAAILAYIADKRAE